MSSSVLKWPDRERVEDSARAWAADVGRRRPDVDRIGYFGSYARGDWGVGSDLDLVAVVDAAVEPFSRRPASWDTTDLPVAAEILVYTHDEWRAMDRESRFGRVLMEETIWLYRRDTDATA